VPARKLHSARITSVSSIIAIGRLDIDASVGRLGSSSGLEDVS